MANGPNASRSIILFLRHNNKRVGQVHVLRLRSECGVLDIGKLLEHHHRLVFALRKAGCTDRHFVLLL